MLSREDSLVRMSAESATGQESRETDQDFGKKCADSLAQYDRVTSSWKTSQVCFDGGLGTVLGDLAEVGFNAEWECLPAAAFGSPQLRERIFIVAYSGSERPQGILQVRAKEGTARRGNRKHAGMDSLPMLRGISVHDPFDSCIRMRMPACGGMVERPIHGQGRWEIGPSVFRVVNGIPRRVDRLRSIGNAVVPEAAEWIGLRIIAAANQQSESEAA